MIDQHLFQFESRLEALKNAMGEFVDILRQEREAIIEFDLEKIKQSHEKKYEALNVIQSLEKARQESVVGLMQESGLQGVPSQKILNAVLEKCCTQGQMENIQNLLSCIRSIAQAAQEFNENQRQYLVHSLENIHTSLMLLDSLQGKGKFQCYNPQGGMQNSFSSKVILDWNI